MNSKPPTIRRLHLRNYRSIRDETIVFDNPLFLVGRNGSGKSNVVDALAFLSDCINIGFIAAIEQRPGITHISTQFYNDDEVRIELETSEGDYILEFIYQRGDGYIITEESIRTDSKYLHRKNKTTDSNFSGMNLFFKDNQVALQLLSSIQDFSSFTELVSRISIHHINYKSIRNMDSTNITESQKLHRDGGNAVGVLAYLQSKHPDELSDIGEYLPVNRWFDAVIPDMHVLAFDTKANGTGFRLSFGQNQNNNIPLPFATHGISDGTLHALGVIVALHQDPAPSLVVIEEPEANLHPGALAVIADLIQEASERMQVVITTHSPELLDQKWIGPENLRVVTWEDGQTRVSPVSPQAQAALTDHLKRRYAGQLLRSNLLQPAPHKTDAAA